MMPSPERVLNPITSRTRLGLNIFSLLTLVGWLLIPHEATWNMRDALITGALAIAATIAILYQLLLFLNVMNPIIPADALSLAINVLALWSYLALQVVYIQMFPGDWGQFSVYPENLLHLELLVLIAGVCASLIAFVAPRPPSESRHQEKPRMPKHLQVLVPRRRIVAIITPILVVGFLVADQFYMQSAIRIVNDCISRNFETRWSSVYRESPIVLSYEYEYPAVVDRVSWEIVETDRLNSNGVVETWSRRIPTAYLAPAKWVEFVQEVSVSGIPALIRRDGVERFTHYDPIALEAMGDADNGPNWNGFVSKLKQDCLVEYDPTFPINFYALWDSTLLLDDISDIPGYVKVETEQ